MNTNLASPAVPTPPVLSEAHLGAFVETGFIHLRKLVPAALCVAAEKAIWNTIPQKPDRPQDWPEGWTQPPGCWDLPEVRACFTPQLQVAIDQLSGVGHHDKPGGPSNSFGPIILYPNRDKTKWKPPSPHIDQHGPMHRTFVVGVLIYLHDVPPGAGGTAMWPGAFRDLEDRSVTLRKLPADVLMVSREYVPPTDYHETSGTIGDILLYTRNGIHASSPNHSERPRFAMQSMVHLNALGEFHCRNGTGPRTPVERIYDRHFVDYHTFNYFGCRAKNQNEA